VTCSLCDRVALYTSGAFFYCKDHQIEAKRMAVIAATQQEAMRAASTGHEGNFCGKRTPTFAQTYRRRG
jgi:hypothetical protein